MSPSGYLFEHRDRHGDHHDPPEGDDHLLIAAEIGGKENAGLNNLNEIRNHVGHLVFPRKERLPFRRDVQLLGSEAPLSGRRSPSDPRRPAASQAPPCGRRDSDGR
ncbi:MAG: hypothetical protein MZV64_71130 [Ignavibacteriales bacterium]|nr:hypothetical protein [Ignavibacteriales bacterium]